MKAIFSNNRALCFIIADKGLWTDHGVPVSHNSLINNFPKVLKVKAELSKKAAAPAAIANILYSWCTYEYIHVKASHLHTYLYVHSV